MSSKILFQLSGSIACYKACSLISRLVQDGFEVQTACTKNALRFIGPATLEGLTGKPVFQDSFEEGKMLGHIRFAREADLAIFCPATANLINKLAAGIADDCVSSLFLAFGLKKPCLLAPAMNHEMFLHPATQASLQKLAGWGVRILPTDEGHQACGETGPGRLLSPERIHEEIRKELRG